MARRAFAALVGVLGVVAVAVLALQTGLWVDIVGVGGYERGTVTVTGSENTTPCTAPPNQTAVAACDEYRHWLLTS
jgi:hypothetical protein